MSQHFFDLGPGHVSDTVKEAAEKAGGSAVNFTEPNGEKRHWYEVPNMDAPFDEMNANKVREAVALVIEDDDDHDEDDVDE